MMGFDIGGDGARNFATAFLLDSCPELFESSIYRPLTFITASLLCRIVFKKRITQSFETELDALHERIGWIEAAQSLEESINDFGIYAQHLRSLVVLEIKDTLSKLSNDDQCFIPLGWMRSGKGKHVVLGVLTKIEGAFCLSIINPGEGAFQKHDPQGVPFSDYPSIQDSVTVTGLTYDDACEYLEKVYRPLGQNPIEVIYDLPGTKVQCPSRSQIQRSSTCVVKVLKRLRKLNDPHQIQDKMYVLSLFGRRCKIQKLVTNA